MVVVYTAILGNCDSLKSAPEGADRCVCFTNDEGHGSSINGWEMLFIPNVEDRPRRTAWHLRAVPHANFPSADVTVWIDASFTLKHLPKLLKDAEGHPLSGLRHHRRSSCYDEGTAVVKAGQATRAEVDAQLNGYRREGFDPTALTISCILVRQNTPSVTEFNNLWDAEIQQHPGDNTQLSLDYCAWKGGIDVHALEGGRHQNPYAVHDHDDHKRRRKPYR